MPPSIPSPSSSPPPDDFVELRASFNLVPFSFFDVLPAFQVTSFDNGVVVFRSLGPVQGAGFTGAFALSVKDDAGRFSGDQVMIQ